MREKPGPCDDAGAVEQRAVRCAVKRGQAPGIDAAARRQQPRLRRFQQFERQVHHPAAALAKAGAEGEALDMAGAATRQHGAADLDGAQFEVAAADGAGHLALRHQHARARLARTGAFKDGDRHQHRRRARGQRPFVHHAAAAIAASTAAIDLRIASLVAGALSGGLTLCPPTADTASRMAKNTENDSSSGGSPTAFER